MIFVISSWKLHLLDNFWTLKTQNTEYNYICVADRKTQTGCGNI